MSDVPQAKNPGYRLSMSFDGDALFVQVSGGIDAQPVRIAYCREILDAVLARDCRKVLVIDRKKVQPASPEELEELARIFSPEAAHLERIAVVEPNPQFLSAIEHAEIHGRAMGINIRIFADPGQAEHWLHFGSADDWQTVEKRPAGTDRNRRNDEAGDEASEEAGGEADE